jgi:hypothetical protein
MPAPFRESSPSVAAAVAQRAGLRRVTARLHPGFCARDAAIHGFGPGSPEPAFDAACAFA